MLVSKSSSPKEIAAKLDTKTQRYQLSTADIAEFYIYVQKQKAENPKIKISLVKYVKEKFYSGQDVIVTPDFSGVEVGKTIDYDLNILKEAFNRDKDGSMVNTDRKNERNFLKNMKSALDSKRELNLDLSGVDFTGCRLEKTKFLSCNLTDVDARDIDLNGVELNDCITIGIDLRGSNISGLIFSEINLYKLFWEEDINIDQVSALNLLEYDCNQRYADMHFSTVEAMLHRYADDNDKLEKDAKEAFKERKSKSLEKKKKDIFLAENRVKNAYINVAYIALVFGGESWNEYAKIRDSEELNIKKLHKEIDEINQQEFDHTEVNKIKFVVHPSVISNLLIVNDSVQNKYDPSYKKGASQGTEQDKIQYIRLNRIDAKNYLKECENNPKLSINEFAKSQIESKNIRILVGARIVADFSVYIDKKDKTPQYKCITTNLSRLDFSNRDLRGACFVGANIQDCNFNKAKLDNATFEGVDASRANFTGVSARDSNFKASKIQSAIIKDADFTRVYMAHARICDLNRDEILNKGENVAKLNIENSIFNLSDMSNVNLDSAQISGSSFDYTDLSGAYLANATIQKSRMINANLKEAILNNCKIIDTNLTNSILKKVEARKSKFKKTILQDANAEKMDFTESEIDEFCIFKNTQLKQAVMQKVTADKVNFIDANMQEINLQQASLKSSVIEGVNLKFANLQSAILDGAKAANADLTSANLIDILARGADFKNANLEGIKSYKGDFSGSAMESVNLLGAKMHDAILELVNFKNADLRNVEFKRANLNNANVNQTIINDKTDLHLAKAKDVHGSPEYEAADGTKTKVSLQKKIERDNLIHAAKNKEFALRLYDNLSVFVNRFKKITNLISEVIRTIKKVIYIVKKIGYALGKIGEFLKNPFSSKFGTIFGAVTGLLTSGAIVFSSMSLAVAASTIIVNSCAWSVVGVIASNGGLASIAIGALWGSLVAGPIGSIIGATLGASSAHVIKELAGKTLDEKVGEIIQKIGVKIEIYSAKVIENEEILVKNKVKSHVIDQNQIMKKIDMESSGSSLMKTKLLSKKIKTYREIVMSSKHKSSEELLG
jgi:uncharacterized protein YjbI with pentapeptide repeats